MILIDGKKAAAELRKELKKEVAELKTKHNKIYFSSSLILIIKLHLIFLIYG